MTFDSDSEQEYPKKSIRFSYVHHSANPHKSRPTATLESERDAKDRETRIIMISRNSKSATAPNPVKKLDQSGKEIVRGRQSAPLLKSKPPAPKHPQRVNLPPFIERSIVKLCAPVPKREPTPALPTVNIVHGPKEIVNGKIVDIEPKFINPFTKPKPKRSKFKDVDFLLKIVNQEEDEVDLELEKTLNRLHSSIPEHLRTPKDEIDGKARWTTQSQRKHRTKEPQGSITIAGTHVDPKRFPQTPMRRFTRQKPVITHRLNLNALKPAMEINPTPELKTDPKITEKPKKTIVLSTKDRVFVEFSNTIPIERLLTTALNSEIYQNRFDQYENNKVIVTRQRVDECLTRLFIKERRNLLHPEYHNPVALLPIRKKFQFKRAARA